MGTNYMTMVNVAGEKYRKVTEYIHRLRNGEEIDYDKILKLISSIHEDEIYLIISMYELERINFKPELSIPDFMKK